MWIAYSVLVWGGCKHALLSLVVEKPSIVKRSWLDAFCYKLEPKCEGAVCSLVLMRYCFMLELSFDEWSICRCLRCSLDNSMNVSVTYCQLTTVDSWRMQITVLLVQFPDWNFWWGCQYCMHVAMALPHCELRCPCRGWG